MPSAQDAFSLKQLDYLSVTSEAFQEEIFCGLSLRAIHSAARRHAGSDAPTEDAIASAGARPPRGGFGETEPGARNPGHRHPERDAARGTGPRRAEHDAQGLGTGSGRMFHVKHSRRPSAESLDRKAQARRRGAPAQDLAPRAQGHAGSEAKDARSGNPETQGTREAGAGVVTRATGGVGRERAGLGRATGAGARDGGWGAREHGGCFT